RRRVKRGSSRLWKQHRNWRCSARPFAATSRSIRTLPQHCWGRYASASSICTLAKLPLQDDSQSWPASPRANATQRGLHTVHFRGAIRGQLDRHGSGGIGKVAVQRIEYLEDHAQRRFRLVGPALLPLTTKALQCRADLLDARVTARRG